ncbi:type II secretion system F family protein [Patescibacteria group bacterium]
MWEKRENKKEQKRESGNFKRKLASSFVSDKERYYLVENLSMLVASGMGIVFALESIADGIKNKGTREIVLNIRRDVDNGVSLWVALEESKLFSDYAVSLIRTGEKSGRLSENLDLISVNHHKDRMFKSKLRSAMMYPILVFGLSVVVGVGIAWFILPRLATVFSQLRLELPLITKVLIGIGEFLGKYGVIFMPSLILIVGLLLFFIFFYKRTKKFGQYFLMKLPFLRSVIQEIELARAGFILGTLIEAGLSVVDAIDSLAGITSFDIYKKFYIHLKVRVEEGESFDEVFEEYSQIDKLIPRPVQQMIITGEKSGKLSDTLIRVGENYETKIETTTKNLSIILEPILLIIVWVGVIFVALAVILPIYSLVGGLNQATSYSTPSAPTASTEQQVEASENEIVEEAEIVIEKEDSEEELLVMIVITETETGYLNVRDSGSVGEKIIGRVSPGDEYELIEEKDGWFHIVISIDDEGGQVTGWVIGDYVERINE